MTTWPCRAGMLSALVAGAVLAGACGPSRSAPSTISAGASASLTQQVSAVRAAAARRDRAGAKNDLDQLRTTVATLEHQGQVSPARSTMILSAAVDVETQLASLSASASTSGTATNAVPAPSGPDRVGGSSRTTTKAPEPSGGGGGGKGRGKDPKGE